jgi:uncharacterized membrane protein YqgA involved in biofilm formation
MGRAEDNIRSTIRESIDERHREISSHILAIFIWGFGFGMVAAYSNLAPLAIGTVLGYYVGKQDFTLIDYGVDRATGLLLKIRSDVMPK